MAHGMKNAAKHVGLAFIQMSLSFPDGFEFSRSLLGAGGIASHCLG